MTISMRELDKMIDIAQTRDMIILRIDLSRIEYGSLLNECNLIEKHYRQIPLRIASHSGIVVMKKEDMPQAYEAFGSNAFYLGGHVEHSKEW